VKFSIQLPVQFRDIDVMGHVNNATYLQYMETARVELARLLGQLTDGIRPDFIVASARCEFKKPLRDERRITVSVWVSRIGDHSWDLDYLTSSQPQALAGVSCNLFGISPCDFTAGSNADKGLNFNSDDP